MQVQSDWIMIYSAANLIEAELLAGLLRQQGICAGVRSQMLGGGIGELPLDALYTPVWVPPNQADTARQVIHNYEASAKQTSVWHCPHCGEDNESSFELCWQCMQPPD